jgi:hypothetical protein
MSYVERPESERTVYSNTGLQPTDAIVDYHDRVRWGPIFSGIVIAISLQLVLSALGAAVGASVLSGSGAPRTNVGGTVTGVGIWAIISALISLFLAGYTTARACGPMTRSTAIFNGAILWATSVVIGTWLLSSGISGAFGILASNAGAVANQVIPRGGVSVPQTPNITANDARNIASNIAQTNWWFALGALLTLIATEIGSTVGVRKPRMRP